MHRTGTSLVSNVLHNAMGVKMGSRFLGKGPWNKQGVWEDLAFLGLNKNLLHAAGADKQTGWKHPPSRERILFLDKVIPWIQRIQTVINAHDGMWGWKDPRTCLTIPLYHRWLENPHYVVTRRRHGAIVASLEKRGVGRQGNGFWQKLIDRYEKDVRDFLEDTDAPYIELYFERMTDRQQWRGEFGRLAEFVGIEFEAEKVRGRIHFGD